MKASDLLMGIQSGGVVTRCGVGGGAVIGMEHLEWVGDDPIRVNRISASISVAMEARRQAHIACPHGYRRNQSPWQTLARVNRIIDAIMFSDRASRLRSDSRVDYITDVMHVFGESTRYMDAIRPLR